MQKQTKSRRTLKDILSNLTLAQVQKLLGKNADKLLQEGGGMDIDISTDVSIDEEALILDVDLESVRLYADSASRSGLNWTCSCRRRLCVHVAAALSLVLEEKTPLGLAVEPGDYRIENEATEEELIAAAMAERQQRADKEKMRVVASEPKALWSDYIVTNKLSGKSYRVALRGWQAGESYCNCPDYRKNTLGTCKHILHTISKVQKRFPVRVKNTPFTPKALALHLQYGIDLNLRFIVPDGLSPEALKIIKPFISKDISDLLRLARVIQKLDQHDQPLIIYPDAEEFIQRRLTQLRLDQKVKDIRNDPSQHSLRTTLLDAELLPYQLDGIAFSAGAGRAILADEMGLGKTIQGIGLAEFLANELDIKRVLVVTPASLKSQWKIEIDRFCNRSSQIILGAARARQEQYTNDSFFTLCNYEQVLRDASIIGP